MPRRWPYKHFPVVQSSRMIGQWTDADSRVCYPGHSNNLKVRSNQHTVIYALLSSNIAPYWSLLPPFIFTQLVQYTHSQVVFLCLHRTYCTGSADRLETEFGKSNILTLTLTVTDRCNAQWMSPRQCDYRTGSRIPGPKPTCDLSATVVNK